MTEFRTATLLAALCVGLIAASADAQQVPRTDQRVEAKRGMVVAAHPDAARAGIAMLQAGGNAIDAAVAAAFAVGVVEPMMSGVGGGGSMVLWLQESRQAWNVEFYASAGADPDSALDAVPAAERHTVRPERWVAVPGAVAGLLEAHERYGALSRATVLEPAVRLARDGFIVRPLLARVIGEEEHKLRRDSSAGELFYPRGSALGVGDRLRQPVLARTLERIQDLGRDGFYRGPLAQRIVAALQAGGNPITPADMDQVRARWRRPVCTTYRDHTVLAAAPPLSGVQVLETLELLEQFDLSALGHPTRSGPALGTMIDAIRIAHADRDAWLGDPRDEAVPATDLASASFATARRSLVGIDPIPHAVEPGDPWVANAAQPPPACAAIGAFPPNRLPAPVRPPRDLLDPEGMDSETTHLSVVDAQGNAVSLTVTIGGYFGYGVYVAGAFFNDAMENFGGTPANRRGNRRTPRSTTAPTIALRDGRVRLVVGSPGGARIPPAIVQTIVYALDYGEDLWTAVARPRVYPSYDTPQVQLEPGFAGDALAALRHRGYDLTARPPMDMYFGGVHAVLVQDDGTLIGAADPRRDGAAVGY
ncbi:MAG: gamma-glutamyltransferase [Gemmatimonadota bacterium]|nr:gamma-glutamyltransferase [Gemmatimonadota bacterium]